MVFIVYLGFICRLFSTGNWVLLSPTVKKQNKIAPKANNGDWYTLFSWLKLSTPKLVLFYFPFFFPVKATFFSSLDTLKFPLILISSFLLTVRKKNSLTFFFFFLNFIFYSFWKRLLKLFTGLKKNKVEPLLINNFNYLKNFFYKNENL